MGSGPGEPVVEVLAEEFGAIAALGDGLGPDDWELDSECPGWTVRDLVSHLIGIERTLLGDPAPAPVAEPPGHVRNALGAANEAWVAERRDRSGQEVLDEFRAVTARRLVQLGDMAPDRFDLVGPSPIGEVPYREFMAVRVMDCWVHEQDLRVAVGRPGQGGGAAAELSVDRLLGGVAFVVGKRAGAGEGQSLRVELTGAVPRVVQVGVVGGKARPVAVTGDPTAGIVLDAETFRRLACGRVDGDAVRSQGLVTVTGDGDLAGRVLAGLGFMI